MAQKNLKKLFEAGVNLEMEKRIASNIADGTKVSWQQALDAASNLVKRDRDASQLSVGMVIQWNPNAIQLVTIGNGQVMVSTCQCQFPSGAVVYRNIYVSTFWKQIPLYDAMGEPILENGQPKVITGIGNKIWENAKNSTYAEVLKDLVNSDGTGKLLRVTKVLSGFGPRYDGGNIVGHRLTTLPLFEEVEE